MGKKTRDLAALAGLAGLAYAYNKGKDKEGPSATAEEKEASKVRMDAQKNAVSGNRVTDTRLKSPTESIAAADKSDKSTSISTKGPSGTTTPGPDKSVPNLDVKPAPVPKVSPAPKLKTITTRKDPREAEAGTSRGQRSFTSRSSGDEMSKAAKNYKAPVPTTSSKVADTVKTVAKTVAQGPAAAAKEPAEKAANAMRETYRDLSGKVQYKTPDIPSAAKTASDAVASGAKKVGSGIADYANRTFTLEGREKAKKEADDARAKAASSREYDEDALSKGSALRRGGMTKMASGGMAASRRGDGIAQRGKTRGKMC